MASAITPEMKGLAGTEIARRVSYPVSASDIRRWAVAVYWPDTPPTRFLTDAETDLVAPEDLNPFAWAVSQEHVKLKSDGVTANDPDRLEKQLGIAGPGLKHQLNGGVTCEYGAPMLVGDTITSTRSLAGYHEREGRLGLMLFTTTEDRWTNQRNELVKKTEMTLIRY